MLLPLWESKYDNIKKMFILLIKKIYQNLNIRCSHHMVFCINKVETFVKGKLKFDRSQQNHDKPN